MESKPNAVSSTYLQNGIFKFGTYNNSVKNWSTPTASVIKSNHGRSIVNSKPLCNLEYSWFTQVYGTGWKALL